MAQAAWSRPALRISSWSCMGPRRRAAAVGSNSNHGGSNTESSSTNGEILEHPPSPSERCLGNECSCSDEMGLSCDADADLHDDEDIMSPNTLEDRMTEVELWQQLEHELYSQTGEEAEAEKEIREEEAAAIAEVQETQTESSVPQTKEVHRFFPPGKIMHIITFPQTEVEIESDTATSSDTDNSKVEVEVTVAETRVGIFLTPRTLYSKLRLSQTMISDHFMPVYRRQIEKLIRELEQDTSKSHDEEVEIVL